MPSPDGELDTGAPPENDGDSEVLCREASGDFNPARRLPAVAVLQNYLDVEVRENGKELKTQVQFILDYSYKALDKDCAKGLLAQIEKLKASVYALALAVDEPTTGAIVALSYLWLRTPAFFIESNLIEAKPAVQGAKNGAAQKGNRLPVPSIDVANLPSADIVSYIDKCYVRAEVECDGHAVTELLAILADDKVQDSVVSHLVAVAVCGDHDIRRRDAARMEHSGRKCALTANWPKLGRARPRAQDYLAFMQEFLSGHVVRDTFRALAIDLHNIHRQQQAINLDGTWVVTDFDTTMSDEYEFVHARGRPVFKGTKTNPNATDLGSHGRLEITKGALIDKVVSWVVFDGDFSTEYSCEVNMDGDYLINGMYRKVHSKIQDKTGTFTGYKKGKTGRGGLSKEVLARMAEDAPGVERELQSFDRLYRKIEDRDKTFHLTPVVIQVLLKVACRGCDDIRSQEAVIRTSESHFAKLNAAQDICYAALHDNLVAQDVFIKHLLYADHWLIRRTALLHSVHILKVLTPTENAFIQVRAALIDLILELPPRLLSPQDKELQTIGLDALAREVPHYERNVRIAIRDGFRQRVNTAGANRANFKKVMDSMPTQDAQAEAVAHKPTMQKLRNDLSLTWNLDGKAVLD